MEIVFLFKIFLSIMSKGGSSINTYQQILTDTLPFGRLYARHKTKCILRNTDMLRQLVVCKR